MKKIKNFLALIIAVVLLGTIGCGQDNGGIIKDKDGNTVYELSFYRTRANNMTTGTYDDEVTKALEDKFFADTGTKVKLTMNIYEAEDMIQKINVGIGNSKVAIDAFSSSLSADSGASLVYKYCIDTYGSTENLTGLLNEYGQDFLKLIRDNDDENHSVERSGYFMINGEMQFKALPSVYNTNYYALMVRKDYWQKAFDSGKTALNPDEYDITLENYKHLTLAQFEEIMSATKQEIEQITYPVTGYSWDLARTIGCSSFNSILDWRIDNGIIYPYQISEEYGELLELCRKWASSGIWEKDSTNTNDDTRTNDFLAGKHTAYIVYPDVEQMITISNRLKTYDSSAETMLIAPLKRDVESQTNGFYSQPASFQGLCVPYDANNKEIMIQFINWMYGNAENYELAKYGIKGTHWVEGKDYTVDFNDKSYTYKTWSYPVAKMTEYAKNTPYSGCWELLRNVNLSDRINDSWTPMQKQWYVYATKVCEGTDSSKTMTGVMLPEVPSSINSNPYLEQINNASTIYGSAVAGKSYGAYPTIKDAIAQVKKDALEKAPEIFNFYKQQYEVYMNWFVEKLK